MFRATYEDLRVRDNDEGEPCYFRVRDNDDGDRYLLLSLTLK